MTAFIKNEALEKAHEIKIKADEEFATEKGKLRQQETDAIDVAYAKKFKQATMSQQITRSTVANKTRLKVLAARQELLDEIFEAAEGKLADLASKDKKKYGETLKNLILEGFYALDEPEVVVRARKADYDLVRTAIDKAAAEFKKALGHEVKGTLDEENPVAEGR
jgi:V-type H+-transporting ATPase subunit E